MATAQRYTIISGELKNLKGISVYNIAFDYNGLTVHGYKTEEDYLADKMRLREHVAGKAEQFREDWFNNREAIYEPAFIDYFNKVFKDGTIAVGKNPDARYTMTVKTTWIYPGYNQGITIEPAKISAVVIVSETANPSNHLVEIAFDKSIGLEHEVGGIFLDKRIAWAYEKIAKNLSIQLKRLL